MGEHDCSSFPVAGNVSSLLAKLTFVKWSWSYCWPIQESAREIRGLQLRRPPNAQATLFLFHLPLHQNWQATGTELQTTTRGQHLATLDQSWTWNQGSIPLPLDRFITARFLVSEILANERNTSDQSPVLQPGVMKQLLWRVERCLLKKTQNNHSWEERWILVT